ncbi:hypothetical protein NKOR_03335 [Candidatus Nitrosopumilus koreensis AR1]|uniref:Uncharacterized protein n=1 Tax=Candidatus Nitrosopumilus koreensis AR1 TaxID=1229908 RepID=K0B7X5_9ARCH|nr:hypothetical protein NKOR_03335 [Candidatus Nitrosopumilus koreensis AR1]
MKFKKSYLLLIIFPIYGTIASIGGHLHEMNAHESYITLFFNPLVWIFTDPHIRYFPVENYQIVLGPELILFFIIINIIFWMPIGFIISKIIQIRKPKLSK